MGKIQRNSPCPCGSGLKYKKCCLNKEQPEVVSNDVINGLEKTMSFDEVNKVSKTGDVINRMEKIMSYDEVNKMSTTGDGINRLKQFMSYDDVNEMSTTEIINKLESIGIPFDENQFMKDIEKYNSASQLSNYWNSTYDVESVNRNRDFLWFGAWVLWERLAPKHVLPIENINDLIQMGYTYNEKGSSTEACDIWLDAWNAIKYRIKKEDKTIDSLDQLYPGNFYSFLSLLQNLEMELQNAGLDNSVYYDKCVVYCREICDYFSDEDELVLHNFRRAIAHSLFESGHIEEAKEEFDRLISDYPNNIWSYIAYGDVYWLSRNEKTKNSSIAKKYYEKALLVAKDKYEKDVVMERIDDIDE